MHQIIQRKIVLLYSQKIPPTTDPNVVIKDIKIHLFLLAKTRGIKNISGGIIKNEASINEIPNNAKYEYFESALFNSQFFNISRILFIPFKM